MVAPTLMPVLKIVTVINSSGMREQRPLVETTAWLGPCRKRIRLHLRTATGEQGHGGQRHHVHQGQYLPGYG